MGFFGGGYNTQGDEEADDSFDIGNKGNGFFVAHLEDGTILWSYPRADNSALYHDLAGTAPPQVSNPLRMEIHPHRRGWSGSLEKVGGLRTANSG